MAYFTSTLNAKNSKNMANREKFQKVTILI